MNSEDLSNILRDYMEPEVRDNCIEAIKMKLLIHGDDPLTKKQEARLRKLPIAQLLDLAE